MQPQQGYPQGPQQYPPQGQPQYGQMPYYPPQKQGMPGWAWALIICGGVFVLMIVGFMFLAFLPITSSNAREARRAEGEQMMGMAKGQARVQFARTNNPPTSFSSFGMSSELRGKYYTVDDTIQSLAGSRARITCTPVNSGGGRGSHEFEWAGGQGTYHWD